MRAIAILCVVCSHVLWVFPEAKGASITLLRFFGIMGVEIFFVLSGFLIGRILFRTFKDPTANAKDWFRFLIRRWFRTLPNYYLVLLLNIAVVIYVGRALPESLPSYFLFLQNFSSEIPLFFTESWSLSIEEFAYVIGPLLLYMLCIPKLKVSRDKLFLFATLGIITFFIGTKWYYNYSTGSSGLDHWNSHLKAVVIYRIDAIYYGVLASYISLVHPSTWKKYTFVALFVGVIGFATLHFMVGKFQLTPAAHPFILNVLYFPLYSIGIACTLPFFSRLKRGPRLVVKAVTLISLISYSMYLLHYSVVLVLLRYWFEPGTFSPFMQWTFALGYVFLTIGLSYLLYRFFEKPMMDLRDRPRFALKDGKK